MLLFPPRAKKYEPPSMSCFRERRMPIGIGNEEINRMIEGIDGYLRDKTDDLRINSYTRGYDVVQFVVETGDKKKSILIRVLSDGIAAAAGVERTAVRVAAEDDRALIEVSNVLHGTVGMRALLMSDEFARAPKFAVPIGAGLNYRDVYWDFAEHNLCLVGGAEDTRLPEFLRALAIAFAYKTSPDELKIIMIGTDKIFSAFDETYPYNLSAPVTDPEEGRYIMQWLEDEMTRRDDCFEKAGCDDLVSYNSSAAVKSNRLPHLPQIITFVSEFSDLVDADNDLFQTVHDVWVRGKYTGIGLILATRRVASGVPSNDVSANLSDRIAFKLDSKFQSHAIIGCGDAVDLTSGSDALLKYDSISRVRFSSAYIDDEETTAAIAAIKERFANRS